ncbi:hypothetical protein B7463_g446, partial [Scytalidium lignicola]
MPPKKKVAEEPASVAEDDVQMEDASVADAQPLEVEDHDPALLAFDEQRIVVVQGQGQSTAATFQFQKEDHTLGNALRYIIMKKADELFQSSPDVEFCGYSIPHPSEPLMNIRIQTYEGTVIDALEKGFNDLMDLCDVVADKFSAAREEFTAIQMEQR